MRIIHINAHYQDGLGYQDYYLGLEHSRQGHEVHFVTSDQHFNFPDYENTVQNIIGNRYIGTGTFQNEYGVPVHRLRGKRIGGLMWLIGFGQKLRELNPKFIISHGTFTFQSVRLLFLAQQLNCRIVFDDHTTQNVIRKGAIADVIFWLFRCLFSRKFLRVAHKIVGISASCMDILCDKFGLYGPKVVLIPLGTDTNLFKPNPSLRQQYRSELGVADDEILVVYTGKMYEEKNVHLIVEALNDPAVTQNKKIVIHLVGNIGDTYRPVLEQKMSQSVNRLIYRPAVEQAQLPSIYNAADVAVWPSHTTTSTIDASACGCPIVCVDYMSERLKNNNGFGIKDGDLSALKQVLTQLISQPELRKKMGQRGLELIENELSWKHISQAFIE